jgi:predicted TIM-barrel fold metal-dependent hydrolase
MGCLSEESRAKILGLNAARVFELQVPSNKP